MENKQTFSLVASDFADAVKISEFLAKSSMIPKDYVGKPENILVAVQMGAELGLKPLQALQNVACINGRPAVWGDAMLALVRSHKEFEWIKEDDDGTKATCTVKRKNQPEHTVIFSNEDAAKAGLLNKTGTWMQYPKRMRQLRARAFCLRDTFADALKGIQCAEEVMDYPTEKNMGDVVREKTENLISNLIQNKAAPQIAQLEKNPYEEELQKIWDGINNAATLEELDTAIEGLKTSNSLNEEDNKRVKNLYKTQKVYLKKQQESAAASQLSKDYFGEE